MNRPTFLINKLKKKQQKNRGHRCQRKVDFGTVQSSRISPANSAVTQKMSIETTK